MEKRDGRSRSRLYSKCNPGLGLTIDTITFSSELKGSFWPLSAERRLWRDVNLVGISVRRVNLDVIDWK